MRFSRKFLIFGSDSEPFSRLSGSRLRNGATLEPPDLLLRFAAPIWSQMASKLMPLRAPSLIPSGRSHLSRCFWKNLQKFCCCAGIRLLPFTFSMVESHFVPPSKRFLHLTHGWRSFCQPIRREFLLQFLTATFAAEKRHDFWKNIPTTLYRNFWTRKTTHFPKLFQKSFLLLYRKFFRSNLNPYFKIFSLLLLLGHLQS